MSLYDPKFDTKINIGDSDLHFLLQCFVLFPERFLLYKYCIYGL